MDLQDIKKLGDELQQGFADLKKAQEKQASDTDSLVKEQVKKIAEDTATKYEAVQAEQQKLSAAIQRVGVSEQDDEKAAAKTRKATFDAFMRAKADVRELTPDQQKAMATDRNPDGGYFVPLETLGVINGRVFESSAMRQIANVITTSAKSIEALLDDQEAGFAWTGEADTVNETGTPTIGRIEIAAHKAIAYPYITEELLADSAFDVEAWLASKVADKIARGENTAFVNGDGISRPRGFLTYTQAQAVGGTYTYARDQLEVVPMGSTSAITENGMINLQGSLKEAYQAGARWTMRRSTLVELMKVNGTGNYRWLNLSAQLAPNKEILGPSINVLDKPVTLMDDMPVIGSNSLSIGYGDFNRGYTIVDRIGLSVRADPYTRPGIIKYYTTKRTGGAVTNFEAIKLSKFSNS